MRWQEVLFKRYGVSLDSSQYHVEFVYMGITFKVYKSDFGAKNEFVVKAFSEIISERLVTLKQAIQTIEDFAEIYNEEYNKPKNNVPF